MTADKFRKLALALPEAIEAEHMGHPDFRVGGKIFATTVRHALLSAWRNTAPKKLVQQLDEE
jgi:hypothetical protein